MKKKWFYMILAKVKKKKERKKIYIFSAIRQNLSVWDNRNFCYLICNDSISHFHKKANLEKYPMICVAAVTFESSVKY